VINELSAVHTRLSWMCSAHRDDVGVSGKISFHPDKGKNSNAKACSVCFPIGIKEGR
jgi:hypothetical protein